MKSVKSNLLCIKQKELLKKFSKVLKTLLLNNSETVIKEEENIGLNRNT